jgi:NAD(P)-dependent dehydrogenase (short-subunit alcohol dehydrogenase family)
MRVLILGYGGIGQGIWDSLTGWDKDGLTKEGCDVREVIEIDSAVSYYAPDWIVNCAGVDTDDLEETIYTNLIGTINVASVAKAFKLPSIHIGSVAGLYGKPGHLAYSASKAGVISVVQSLGFDQPIWAISPGRVDTPMREAHYPDDTPGSRLDPVQVGEVARDIIVEGRYASGTNVVIRKVGLHDVVVTEHTGDGWRETLRVGEPVTI